MDQEHILNSFSEIEKQIDILIESCAEQEATIKSLQDRIQELELTLQGKQNLEARFNQEKAVVKQKIDDLLNKLEDFATKPR